MKQLLSILVDVFLVSFLLIIFLVPLLVSFNLDPRLASKPHVQEASVEGISTDAVSDAARFMIKEQLDKNDRIYVINTDKTSNLRYVLNAEILKGTKIDTHFVVGTVENDTQAQITIRARIKVDLKTMTDCQVYLSDSNEKHLLLDYNDKFSDFVFSLAPYEKKDLALEFVSRDFLNYNRRFQFELVASSS